MRRKPLALAAIAVGLPLLYGTTARAQATWNGGGADNLWTDGGNWVGGAPPVPGTSALSFDGVTQLTNQNNFTNATFKGIGFTAGAGGFDLTGNALHLGVQTTGTGITGSSDIVSAALSDQTIDLGVTLDVGKHAITTGTNALNLHGTITPVTGSTAVFTTGGGAINTTGSGLSNDTSDGGGILGGWATTGSTWAALDGSGNVVPYSAGFTDYAGGGTIATGATNNARISTSGTAITMAAGGVTNVNTLLFAGTTAAQTVTVGAGNTLVLGQSGGILNTSSSGGTVRNLTIGAGTLTAGDGINPATITLTSTASTDAQRTAGAFTISSSITNNGTAPVSVVLAGGYATLSGANTYSGGTYVLSGRVSQPNATTFGSGPVYIFPGAYINPGLTGNLTISNNFFIAGNGTPENNGLGAIRAFQGGNFTTQLTGTLTLTDNASISSNGLTATQIAGGRHVDFSGQITGPGGLGIGSPTTNNNNGTGIVEIGALTGTAAANNYAGDTTINGAAATATVGAALRIAAAGDNNIMPHGSTGSFSGGATGNVILNATAAARSATFDLNGSTQTINGLSNSGTSPANDIVTSSAAGAQLILGDNNATASFGGNIQDGASGATVAVTKIGNGNQTLGGVDAYTGGTTINAGTLTLASATALPSAANVANNGTLAVNANTTAGNVSGTGATSVAPGISFTANNFTQGGLPNAGTTQINGSGTTGVITGAGTLTLGTVAGPNTNTLALASGSGQGTQSALTVNPGSTLDLTNNSFDIHYGTNGSPDSTVRSLIISGRNGGAWTGTGITSSHAAVTSGGAVGYADGADGVVPSLAAGDELLKYTLAGDANLDGTVSFSDFQVLAENFGAGGKWDQADFNYDGQTSFSDFQLLAENFGNIASLSAGQLSSLQSFAEDFGDSLIANASGQGFTLVAVPEPASVGLLGLGALALLGRRRRNSI